VCRREAFRPRSTRLSGWAGEAGLLHSRLGDGNFPAWGAFLVSRRPSGHGHPHLPHQMRWDGGPRKVWRCCRFRFANSVESLGWRMECSVDVAPGDVDEPECVVERVHVMPAIFGKVFAGRAGGARMRFCAGPQLPACNDRRGDRRLARRDMVIAEEETRRCHWLKPSETVQVPSHRSKQRRSSMTARAEPEGDRAGRRGWLMMSEKSRPLEHRRTASGRRASVLYRAGLSEDADLLSSAMVRMREPAKADTLLRE